MKNRPRPTARRVYLLLALAGLTGSGEAAAGYGAYLHGFGPASDGAGGVGFSVAMESYALSANPALAGELGNRIDFALHHEEVAPSVRISGNLLGPDRTYHSSKRHFPIPQAGFARALGDGLAIGVTGFAAGAGATYNDSPLARFGGPSQASLSLGQVGVSSALAWEPVEHHWVGLSFNLSYQLLKVKGAQAFELFSQSPDRVSNRGSDGSFGVGYTLGYHGRINDGLQLGASYHSKTWAQRSEDYAGLLPDQGSLDLPATVGAGLAITPLADFTIAVEMQRVLYARQTATGNGIEQFTEQGQRLGSNDGPGFGWRNQNIVKLGLMLTLNPRWQLRAGYSHGTEQIGPSETLFAVFAPTPIREHYTVGATYALSDRWDVTGFVAAARRATVHGDQSIPLILGGGNVDLMLSNYSAGLSFARSL